jgi:hypothetical protein
LLLDLGGLVLRDVVSMLTDILRQRLDGQNGMVVLDALMVLEEKGHGCELVF